VNEAAPSQPARRPIATTPGPEAVPPRPTWTFDFLAPTSAAISAGPRLGLLHTPHGPVRTPAFMPVGTAATVKAMLTSEVRATGADILLANTFHLHLRPGEAIVRRAGGLHRFMNWDGPILTDSGGFQVFSLAELRSIKEEGVRFRSPVDGRWIDLSPERATEIQHHLGSDIMMAFDECPPREYDVAAARASSERTLRWLDRCLGEKARLEAVGVGGSGTPQTLFPICQGGVHPELRVWSARETAQRPAVGFAVGGLSVGEEKDAMYACLDASISELPADRPRYLMGVGTPADFIHSIERGIDMFDCVLPTRNARNAHALTWEGKVVIKNSPNAQDFGPLSASCSCPTCCGYSRAYLHHLTKCREILSARLISYHNLHFFQDFMQQARVAIAAGDWGAFRDRVLAVYPLK
jgi:queuine tRNA-ribosyltransferase